MAHDVATILKAMRANPAGVSFNDAMKVCEHYFGQARERGSHRIFKMKWPGNPRANLQETENGKAKPYQVRQVLECVDHFNRLKRKKD